MYNDETKSRAGPPVARTLIASRSLRPTILRCRRSPAPPPSTRRRSYTVRIVYVTYGFVRVATTVFRYVVKRDFYDGHDSGRTKRDQNGLGLRVGLRLIIVIGRPRRTNFAPKTYTQIPNLGRPVFSLLSARNTRKSSPPPPIEYGYVTVTRLLLLLLAVVRCPVPEQRRSSAG